MQDGVSVSYPIQLRSGYETISGLATTTGGGVVWLFAQGTDPSGHAVESVFRWSASTQQLQTFPVTPPLPAGADTPIAVDASGYAWVGVNEELLRVSPDGNVSKVQLSSVPVAAPSSGLPGPPRGGVDPERYTGVEALATDSSGQVVVGRRFSTPLELVSPTSLAIAALPLPAGTELAGLTEDLAGDSSTAATAVLYSSSGQHELGELANGGWTVYAKCPTYQVSVAGSYAVASGPTCLAITAASAQPTPPAVSTFPMDLRAQAWAAGPGDYVTSGTGGVFFSAAGNRQGPLSLGTMALAPSSGIGSVPARQEPIKPGLAAGTGSGGLWFVPEQGGTSVGLMAFG